MERRCRNCKNSQINKSDGESCTNSCENWDGFEPIESIESVEKEYPTLAEYRVITKGLVGAWTFDSIGIEPERNTSMYHVMVIRKDEKTGELLEIVKDLGIVVAKNKQAAIAEGILACPKEIKDGATSVILASSDGFSGRINYS